MIRVLEAGTDSIVSVDEFSRSAVQGHRSLLLGRNDGLFDFFDNRLIQIGSDRPNAVHVSRTQPSRLAVAHVTGIGLFEFNQSEWENAGDLNLPAIGSVTSLHETSDGRLVVATSDGTVLIYAPEQWLEDVPGANQTPLTAFSNPRKHRPDVTPLLAGYDDNVHLFVSSSPLLWNARQESFSIDVRLATELGIDEAYWYAAGRSKDSLLIQSNKGTFSVDVSDEQRAFQKLPVAVDGASAGKGVFIDEVNDHILFATPQSIVQLPISQTDHLGQQRVLSALYVRQLLVNGTTIYWGNGTLPVVDLATTETMLELDLSAMEWDRICDDSHMEIALQSNPSRKYDWPVDGQCRAKFQVPSLNAPTDQILLRLKKDDRVITDTISIDLSFQPPWFSSMAVPLILGVGLIVVAFTAGLTNRKAWPEFVRRYVALLSGLLICLSAGIGFGIIAPSETVSELGLQVIGLAVAALLLPPVVEGGLRLTEPRTALKR